MSTPSTTTTSVTKTTVVTQNVTGNAGAKKSKKTILGGEKKKRVHSHKNAALGTTGLMRFSRGRMFHRRAIWRIGKWKQEQAKARETLKKTPKTKTTTGATDKKLKKQSRGMKKKPIGGDRNGKERLVRTKRFPRFYPTEERPKKFRVKSKKFSQHPRRFRSTLTPGTVVIMVAGKHAGKRAIIVKHLKSGLLLLSGPHKYNGVKLCRMNQIYVIGTSTKIDLSTAKFDHLEDKFFKRVRKQKKNAESDIFDKKKREITIK